MWHGHKKGNQQCLYNYIEVKLVIVKKKKRNPASWCGKTETDLDKISINKASYWCWLPGSYCLLYNISNSASLKFLECVLWEVILFQIITIWLNPASLSRWSRTLTPILQMSRGDKNRLSDCCLRSSMRRERLGTGECSLRSYVCDKSRNSNFSTLGIFWVRLLADYHGTSCYVINYNYNYLGFWVI